MENFICDLKLQEVEKLSHTKTISKIKARLTMGNTAYETRYRNCSLFAAKLF